MPPDNAEGRPGREAASEDETRASGYVASKVPRWSPGCPCGCRTRLPWVDDPECVRHQPFSFDWSLYEPIGAGA